MRIFESKEVILDIPGNLKKTFQEKWFDLKNSKGDKLGYIANEGMDTRKISIFEGIAKPVLTNHNFELFSIKNEESNKIGFWDMKGKWFKEKTFFLYNTANNSILFVENASILDKRYEEKTIEIKEFSGNVVASLFIHADTTYQYQRAKYHLKIIDSTYNPILIYSVFLALFFNHWGDALIYGE